MQARSTLEKGVASSTWMIIAWPGRATAKFLPWSVRTHSGRQYITLLLKTWGNSTTHKCLWDILQALSSKSLHSLSKRDMDIQRVIWFEVIFTKISRITIITPFTMASKERATLTWCPTIPRMFLHSWWRETWVLILSRRDIQSRTLETLTISLQPQAARRRLPSPPWRNARAALDKLPSSHSWWDRLMSTSKSSTCCLWTSMIRSKLRSKYSTP